MADTIINTGNVLPEYEKRKTWETTTPGDRTVTPGDESTTETTTESPERLAAERGMDDAATAELAVAERGKAAGVETARLGGVAAQEQSDLAAHQAADRSAAQGIANDEIARAREYHARKQAELDNTPDVSLWGGARHPVLNGIAMALGGIGDAIQRAAMVRIGKAPPTIDTVGDIITGELNRQRDHITKLKDSVVMARTGIADAKEAREQMLQDVDHNGAEMYKRLEALSRARLAAQGVNAAGIEGDRNIAAIRSKRAEHQSAYVAPLVGRVTKKIQGATVTKEGPSRKVGGEAIERAPSAAGVGKSPTGATAEQSAALAKYVDEHPNASQGDLVGVAKNLGIPDAQGEVTRVAGTNSLPEKERERQTIDMEGKPVLAPSSRNAGSVADQVASTHRAVSALDGLIGTIDAGSGIGNTAKALLPGSELNAKIAEATGLISGAMGLTPSDAKLKMDHAMSGTGGVGMLTGGAAEALKRIRDEVQEFGSTKVKGMTTPVRAPAPPEAKSEPAKSTQATRELPHQAAPRAETIAEARKWLVSPEARKDPAKRKRVYDKLKAMGEKF